MAQAPKPIVCSVCGNQFLPWRKKEFCSERCRKRAQNRRLRAEGADMPESPNSEKNHEQNQGVEDGVRRDESPAFKVAHANWIFSNDVTGKLDYQGKPLGWVMYADRPGCWFGRVRDDRGQWSFRAANRERAERAVEAWIRYEPIERREGERMWAGDCLGLI
jgi:hypothetical protein